MTVTLRPAAREDLRDIWVYGRDTWGEAAADQYFDDLTVSIDRLADHPLSAPVSAELGKGYRRLVSAAHVVFYVVNAESVAVVRVLHQSRDAGVWAG
jgi:toxin ParE1/3/4